jgi:hypothetical protein
VCVAVKSDRSQRIGGGGGVSRKGSKKSSIVGCYRICLLYSGQMEPPAGNSLTSGFAAAVLSNNAEIVLKTPDPIVTFISYDDSSHSGDDSSSLKGSKKFVGDKDFFFSVYF